MTKEQAIIQAYNQVAGRNIKALPREKRIKEAMEVFDVDDFRNTFLWAYHDEWCKERDILRTRVGWLCSYDVVAQHSDFEPPEKKEDESWVME